MEHNYGNKVGLLVCPAMHIWNYVTDSVIMVQTMRNKTVWKERYLVRRTCKSDFNLKNEYCSVKAAFSVLHGWQYDQQQGDWQYFSSGSISKRVIYRFYSFYWITLYFSATHAVCYMYRLRYPSSTKVIKISLTFSAAKLKTWTH